MRYAGAPAVLVQAKVRGQEWSRAYGVRSLEKAEPAQAGGLRTAAGPATAVAGGSRNAKPAVCVTGNGIVDNMTETIVEASKAAC